MSDRDYDPYARLDPVPSFPLTSDDITDGQPLPAALFGTDAGGGNRSPQLTWSDPPEGTKSFAVTVYDPDAPTGSGFWHWAVADIPAHVTSLAGGGPVPDGALELRNELREPGFIGAGPPPGTGVHRYFVVVHAVDVETLGLDPESTPAVLGFNLHFHTLGRAILIGTGEAGGAS
ncbi:YbhB/YbcL family Raf kinase inhibitor-like protein [uncultured Amnibacterium sp.]|uniref:YbhB/YbcL family Raf kinase inhibitor-like protein n=1 Tax=uncultured Amnibacterium sp. TaxID=1631851 RepID=UPI0035CA5A69